MRIAFSKELFDAADEEEPVVGNRQAIAKHQFADERLRLLKQIVHILEDEVLFGHTGYQRVAFVAQCALLADDRIVEGALFFGKLQHPAPRLGFLQDAVDAVAQGHHRRDRLRFFRYQPVFAFRYVLTHEIERIDLLLGRDAVKRHIQHVIGHRNRPFFKHQAHHRLVDMLVAELLAIAHDVDARSQR